MFFNSLREKPNSCITSRQPLCRYQYVFITNQRSDQLWGNGSASAEQSRAASQSSVNAAGLCKTGSFSTEHYHMN